MRRIITGIAAVMLLPLAGCDAGSKDQEPVTGAWVRLPAVSGRPGAAYFDLHGGPSGTTLVGVASGAAERAELHESMQGSGGMMTMAPIEQVAVPAGGTVAFAPGGKHVMLYGLSDTLRAGETAPLTFRFADGAQVQTRATIVSAGDPAPAR